MVALSGDYDFQFLIEELAVGAQFRLPYVQVVVNNSYLGLIRQSQRGFEMDYCVQLAFENQMSTTPALQGYGVDHVKVVEGLGCKAMRVTDPEKIQDALRQAQQMAQQYRVPVVVECILERVTNIAMGTEIDKINEFEDSTAATPKAARAWRWPACWSDERHHDAEICRQPVDAVHRSAAARTLRARGRAPGFQAVECSFPTNAPAAAIRDRLVANRPEDGAAQPAGRRLGGRRARHRLRPGRAWPNSAPAWPRPSSTPPRWACRSSTAWPASRPPAWPTPRRATPSWPTCASPPRS